MFVIVRVVRGKNTGIFITVILRRKDIRVHRENRHIHSPSGGSTRTAFLIAVVKVWAFYNKNLCYIYGVQMRGA